MKIINCRLNTSNSLVDIVIENGVIKRIGENLPDQSETVIDAGGCLVIPPFVDSHIHLDYVLTAGDPEWNQSGTLFEGIQRWAQRKEKLSEQDVIDRAIKTIKMCVAHGTQFFRTHVDVTDSSLTSMRAMLKVKEMTKDLCEIQIVSFPQEGILSFENGRGKELVERGIELGADVVGAIPHCEYTREYGVESIKFVMELAAKYNVLVDVHCDEIDDEQSRFVEVLAAEAIRLGIGEKVTASHTCAMGSYNDSYTYKLFNVLKQSKINFISCPTESIHLQGRMDTYPKRRGLTRVKELLEAGMNVCFAEDSIVDPWYPFGDGNILNVLFHGVHIAQLTGYKDMEHILDLITYNGAKTLHIEERYGIEEGKPGNLIILDTDSPYNAVRTQAAVLYSIRNGKVIAQTIPEKKTVCGETIQA